MLSNYWNSENFVSVNDFGKMFNNQDIENYEFRVEDSEGNEIDDYPMPNHTKISVNRSTNVATDTFGIKYPIIWE